MSLKSIVSCIFEKTDESIATRLRNNDFFRKLTVNDIWHCKRICKESYFHDRVTFGNHVRKATDWFDTAWARLSMCRRQPCISGDQLSIREAQQRVEPGFSSHPCHGKFSLIHGSKVSKCTRTQKRYDCSKITMFREGSATWSIGPA